MPIKRGDIITAKYLNRIERAAVRRLVGVGTFGNDDVNVSSPVRPGTSHVGGGSVAVNIKIVLIDKDISAITERDPPKIITAEDIDLTAEEVSVGVEVVLQDPPDDDLDANHVDELNLWTYKRRKEQFKYYVVDSESVEVGIAAGGSSNTIILDEEASDEDDFYVGDTITLGDDVESGTVALYDGDTHTATMEEDWETPPVADETTYDIQSARDLRLSYTVVSDAGDESVEGDERKIVRYSTTFVWYDDGQAFERGEYGRADYPEYDENLPWPPDDLPEDFLKKRYRGIAINNVLVTALCKALPPPELPEGSA